MKATPTSAGRFNTIVITLLAILLIVVAVQSAFLLKLNRKVVDPQPITPDSREHSASNDGPSIIDPDAPAPAPAFGVGPFDFDTFQNLDPDWNPFQEMERMRERIDSMFGDSFGKLRSAPGFDDEWLSDSFMPEADIQETDAAYIVTIDLPGAKESKVDVTVEDGVVTIKGTREEVKEENNLGTHVRRERRLGSFQRSFTLPGPANEGDIQTDFTDGVLTVTIPKATEDSDLP